MVDYNKPSLKPIKTKTSHLPTSLGLSLGDYIHLKYNNEITKDTISDFKNNKNIQAILSNESSSISLNTLKYIVKNHNKILETYYTEIKKYNIGVNNSELSTHNNYTLWNKSIENMFWSINLLEYIKKIGKKEIRIVEVGCGFGDVYIFTNMFSELYNIKIKYTIIDLKDWIKKVKQYLSVNNIDISNITFINYEDLCNSKKTEKYDVFFSKSAYSELNGYIRQFYIDNVVSKCNYIYIVWNYLWSACREHGVDEYFKDKCNIEKINSYDIVITKI